MKILVPVKRVVDYNVKVRAKADESGPDLSNAKMAINPFCEIAIEEAVRLKESGNAEEVVAVSVGDAASQEQLRTCLALGADRAILIETSESPEPLGVAKALKAIVEKENPEIIIFSIWESLKNDPKLQKQRKMPPYKFAPKFKSRPGREKIKKKQTIKK